MKGSIQILHLEDNPADAEIIREILEAGNFDLNVVIATSKEKYLTQLDQGQYDLILSDFTLPGFDGLSALKEAQQQSRRRAVGRSVWRTTQHGAAQTVATYPSADPGGIPDRARCLVCSTGAIQ